MKHKINFLILSFISLTCCQKAIIKKMFYHFDTLLTVNLYNEKYFSPLDEIFSLYDKLADNYQSFNGINNINLINSSNEEIEIDKKLFNLFKRSQQLEVISNNFYNPLIGSLSKKWKTALDNNQILSDDLILEELDKMHKSSIVLKEENNKFYVQRIGSAEIDFGAITKGFVLDEAFEYLKDNNVSKYLIDCGSSSLLFGQKDNKSGLFRLSFKDAPQYYIDLKNCFVGVSGTSERGKIIDNQMYSHIINPFDGSAINKYDFTFVKGNNGALCDVLATIFMMLDIEEIQKFEVTYNVQSLIYLDGEFVYQNKDLDVRKF